MKRVSQKIAKQIINTTDHENARFKNYYFWSPPSIASSRRAYEKNNSFEHNFYFIKNKEKIIVSITFGVICTCSQIHLVKLFKINDKICNITKLRNIAKTL